MDKMVSLKHSPLITKICSTDSSHILDDRGEPPLWPLNVVETLWCLGKFYPRDLYDSLKALKKAGYSRQELAKTFRFPTRLTDLFHFIEIPPEGLTVDQKEELFADAVEMAKCFRKDPFCRNGRNEIWSEKQITNALKSGEWLKVGHQNSDLAGVLGKLHALIFLYCEFIWVGGRHQLSHEIHGPYPLGGNKLLLVREYYDLKPEVWSFSSLVPMESFSLLEIYESVSIKLDCYNHIEFSEPLIKKLKSFSLVGGSPNQIQAIYNGINAALLEGNKFVGDFQKSDWLKKAIEMQAWSIKPLKDLLHKDWRPEPTLIQKLEGLRSEPYVNELFREVGQIVRLGGKRAQRELTNYFVQKFYDRAV